MSHEADIAYTQAVATELALRFALSIGQELNAIADEFENEAEIMRRESRWQSQADADDFDCRR